MGVKDKIGIQIKTMRKSRGMTQEDLAKAIGQSASSITMYETGRREPDFETLEALADAFNVPLRILIDETGETTIRITQPDDEPPRSQEARILSKGVDRMSPEQRAQVLAVVKAMFAAHPEIFEEGNNHNDA